jgi:hypothetical protein
VTSWLLSDPQALAELLELHVSARPRILDCTDGRGRVWGRLPIRERVVKTDVQPLPGLDLVCERRKARSCDQVEAVLCSFTGRSRRG